MSKKNNYQSIVVLGGGFLGKNITSYFKKKYRRVNLIDREICDLLDLKKL
jgi:NADH dehydrogenase FAD-containing subunit